ncbi:vacuolar protein sorting-associated protein 54-like [Diaphorina citri]|uniref:Vacuolar protein sorting-associated protein 54-like n=1 Tax=Diaphorina citri TaxID=121845 RepID=A0A1S4EDL5_DIACI|nr:vacuolar protein sorting-associated protein 54-like [Diaphorina citri]
MQIHRLVKSKLRELLVQMNIKNDGGPQYGLVVQELLFYLENLKQIDALPVDELSLSSMDDIWTNEK